METPSAPHNFSRSFLVKHLELKNGYCWITGLSSCTGKPHFDARGWNGIVTSDHDVIQTFKTARRETQKVRYRRFRFDYAVDHIKSEYSL